MSAEDPYLLPGTEVLKNRLGVRDAVQLDRMERRLVVQRAREGIPDGDFDLTHLQAIHRHLFQDVFEWAGELRTVEIAKGGHQFQFRQFIATGMADVRRRLDSADFLRGLSPVEFASAAGRIIGDVNYVHPFRDSTGRAQLQYLDRLAAVAGHPMDLARLDPERWTEASRRSHDGDYAPFASDIGRALRRGGGSPP